MIVRKDYMSVGKVYKLPLKGFYKDSHHSLSGKKFGLTLLSLKCAYMISLSTINDIVLGNVCNSLLSVGF